ncbi:MAG: FAD-binding oxidoreductase [Patescibacteria group bacterium]|nr:FAD-binding oxidoreductase [Patescibacteria group bacterium]
MGSNLSERLARLVKGDVATDGETRKKHSRDTSIFERMPEVVVFPKDADDVSAVVRYAHEARGRGEQVSVTGRSAGTDITGGPLTDSIVLSFTKYMNHMGDIRDDEASAEPGMYYRDFEKQTLAKTGKLMPSYPASREICAIGGIVSNDSGGELTLKYGKTNRFVRSLDVVLSDGSQATLRALSARELEEKKREHTLEGEIYRKMHALISEHDSEIEAARPTVRKNSAGYALWNVVDKERGTFDLAQLICGSQGTLALVTEATLGLVELEKHRSMLVVFLSDLGILPEIVRRVLNLKPETFESYDKYTFQLAIRFIFPLLRSAGLKKMIWMGISFIPEVMMVLTGGIPKLVLMAEFAEDSADEALQKAEQAQAALHGLAVRTEIEKSERQAAKFWAMRRESFNLLRKHMPGMTAASFIEDIVVHPEDYPKFLPELEALLSQYNFTFTIAGHIGDGNFHIYPFIDMDSSKNRQTIMELQPKVYDLVLKYHGSITGEHNDGIIRTPYLTRMFGEDVVKLFTEVKHIFDPLDVLNPGKKVGGTMDDIKRFMLTHQ